MLVAGKERCVRCMHLLNEEGQCVNCHFDARAYQQPYRALPLGTCLRERYFVGKVLGEGGFGITYVAWDIVLMVPVAVKEYFPDGIVKRDTKESGKLEIYEGKSQLEFEKGKEDFLREARSLSRFMKLPSIVSVRDFFQENQTAYIVMEYVEGTRVRNYVKAHGKMSGKLVLTLMEPVIRSLCQIHKTGLIHRDISIDNIMIDEEGQLKLIDFGEARNVETHPSTITISIKRGFSPEEQYRAKGEMGPWTDLYSLCGTMYYMMTGEIPEESLERVYGDHLVPLSQMDSMDIPKRARKAIDRGLAVHAQDRYPDMECFYQELYPEGKKKKEADVASLEPMPEETVSPGTVSKLFSKTAVQRELGSIFQKKKKSKLPWIVGIGIAVISFSLIGLYFMGNDNTASREGEMEKSQEMNSEAMKNQTASPVSKSVEKSSELLGNSGSSVEATLGEVPEVIGLSLKKGTQKLEEAGLKVKIQRKYSKKAKNKVILQSIEAGTIVKKSSWITLTVSKGKKPKSNNPATAKPVSTSSHTNVPSQNTSKEKTNTTKKSSSGYDGSLDDYLQ